jgi:hypothetical protein
VTNCTGIVEMGLYVSNEDRMAENGRKSSPKSWAYHTGAIAKKYI